MIFNETHNELFDHVGDIGIEIVYFNQVGFSTDLNKIKVVEDLAPLTQSHIERLDWWLSRDDGTTVECDFLKFENLKNEWDRYKEVLNVTRFLPHKNGSSTIPFSKSRSLYNDESHGIVSEIYKDEIERFDYE